MTSKAVFKCSSQYNHVQSEGCSNEYQENGMEWSVHECILDNPIEVESDDVVKNAEVSNQDDVSQNAVDQAMLKKQLHCPSLFRLWRTGAFALRYEASKDDEDFDVNHKFLHFNNAYVLFILTGNRAECTRRRICTKQRIRISVH